MRSKPRILLLGGTSPAAEAVLRLLGAADQDVTLTETPDQPTDAFDILVVCDPSQPGIVRELARLRVGNLEIDRIRQRVWQEGREILLTPHEYRILETLMLNAGEVVSRDRLRRAVWEDLSPASNAVDVHLGHLRRKLVKQSATAVIHTARGRGYVLRVRTETAKDRNHADPRH